MEHQDSGSSTEVPSGKINASIASQANTLEVNVNSDDMKSVLETLFVAYAKLLASTHDWSTKDYFDKRITSEAVKLLLFGFSGLIHNPESRILVVDFYDRRFAIKRIASFVDNLLEILEDIERCKPTNLDRLIEIKDTILHFKKQIPDYPKGLTPYQIAPIVSTVIASVILGYNFAASYQSLYVNAIFTFGGLGLMLLGLWVAISLAFAFRGYIWYRIMAQRFQIKKKELSVLRAMRPLTKKVSDWMYGSLSRNETKPISDANGH